MEKIYIGFSYHKTSLVSKIIQKVEDSKYSHVYIRRKSKYGEYIYQASGLAVNFMNIDIFLDHNVIIEEYEFEFPDDKKEQLIQFFIKYAGASYEFKSLFKLLAILFCERLNIELKLDDDSKQDDKFICSELSAFFCELILNIDIPGNINYITPKRLIQLFELTEEERSRDLINP